MNPNLAGHNIINLRIIADIPFSNDIIAKVHEISPPNDEGSCVFLDYYTSNGVRHRAWVWIGQKDTKSQNSLFDLNFESGKGWRLRKDMPRIKALMDILSQVNDVIGFTCLVDFKYKRGLKVRPIIPLPLRLIDSPDMPFNEIDMLHLVKTEGKKEKYSVILGTDRGLLRQNIQLDYSTKIQETMIDEIIREATSISNRFTIEGK